MDMQAKDIMTHHDPILLNLQDGLAQAWLELERFEQETISLQKYEEL